MIEYTKPAMVEASHGVIPLNAELLVLEQLGERDVRFIVSSLVEDPDERERVARLACTEPMALEAMLADNRVAEHIIADQEILLRISPYLLFAVLLRQVRRDLNQVGFSPEWSAPRARVPVFDTATLTELMANQEVLHYLADMLASFARVQITDHGPVSTAAAGNFVHAWGTSQLDIKSLIRLSAESPHAQRLAVFRRVGDVALLLTGVFPDFMGHRSWEGWTDRVHANLKGLGVDHGARPQRRRGLGPAAEVEEIGRRYYRMAARHPNAAWLGWDGLLNRLAEEFGSIRKILTVLSDQYIHRLRCAWFPGPDLE